MYVNPGLTEPFKFVGASQAKATKAINKTAAKPPFIA